MSEIPELAKDYSKSRAVVRLELFLKALTAIGVVAVGVAGFMLQDHLAVANEAAVALDRLERTYTPLLQGITEVDAALLAVTGSLAYGQYSPAEARRESALGARLAYFCEMTVFKDPGPTVTIATAVENARAEPAPKCVSMPTRDAILMLAELMRFAPDLQRWDAREPGDVITVADGEIVLTSPKSKFVDAVLVEPEARHALESWLPREGITVHDLYREVDITTMANALHESMCKAADAIVAAHQALAPEYVKIREDVYATRLASLGLPR